MVGWMLFFYDIMRLNVFITLFFFYFGDCQPGINPVLCRPDDRTQTAGNCVAVNDVNLVSVKLVCSHCGAAEGAANFG